MNKNKNCLFRLFSFPSYDLIQLIKLQKPRKKEPCISHLKILSSLVGYVNKTDF